MVYSFSKPCGIEQDQLKSEDQSVTQLTLAEDKHSDDECCEIDCCDLNCICAANSCSMMTFTIGSAEYVNAKHSSELVELDQLKSPSSIQPPLYQTTTIRLNYHWP